tara:strand:+ start:118 stop:1308 length:1191 start_codon:yes stop_codon:yes gene_type:complete
MSSQRPLSIIAPQYSHIATTHNFLVFVTIFLHRLINNILTGQYMRAVYLLSLLIFITSFSGCLSVPLSESCDENDCFPFTNDSFSSLLSQDNAFDVISYSELFPQMRVEATLVTEQQFQRGEIYWNVVKDDQKGISSIASRLVLGETVLIDTEFLEGKETNNYRIGDTWYEGRDEMPEYTNPFIRLAKSASIEPGGFWPPFAFNTKEIANLDWTISADTLSTQQVASASNDTHSIFIETRGLPPMIVSIETHSGDGDKFILKVSTDNVSISMKSGLTRAPAPFYLNPNPTFSGEITYWSGIISDSLSIEIKPEELEIHGLLSDGVNATSTSFMRFDTQHSNQTLDDGSWWEFYWIDYLGENLVSNGDLYTVRTNSTEDLTIAIYDTWANSWTDQAF